MKKIILACLFLLVTTFAFAEPSIIQRVQIEPLSSGVSFNTITFMSGGYTGWVTAPSVEMRGRKRLTILNNASSGNVYLTGVSGSSAVGTLGAGKVASFGAASDLRIYVSSSAVTTVDIWEIR